MQRVTFKEYGASGTKQGKCPKCGKKASRSKKFWQTQNPFNKNDKDEMKSISEIQKELPFSARRYQSFLLIVKRH